MFAAVEKNCRKIEALINGEDKVFTYLPLARKKEIKI